MFLNWKKKKNECFDIFSFPLSLSLLVVGRLIYFFAINGQHRFIRLSPPLPRVYWNCRSLEKLNIFSLQTLIRILLLKSETNTIAIITILFARSYLFKNPFARLFIFLSRKQYSKLLKQTVCTTRNAFRVIILDYFSLNIQIAWDNGGIITGTKIIGQCYFTVILFVFTMGVFLSRIYYRFRLYEKHSYKLYKLINVVRTAPR